MLANPDKYGSQKLKTFSIGLKGAPDLKYAKMVADYLGTDHYEFHFEPQDGINAINDVIYHLETYDITTIRASTPMFLMSQKIKELGIKMVLSGEGADEIFGGYLYFHQAPSDKDFDTECRTRVFGLHLSDCLRANKSTMAHSIEVRVPFLDKDFLEVAMLLHPQVKCKRDGKIEKYCLREAFNDGTFLPNEILWRQKEQFSDGVGYEWIDSLRKYTETHVLSHDLDTAYMEFQHNTPMTREALYYRKVFTEFYPQCETTVVKWVPKTEWKGVSADPSGRAQLVHLEHKGV
jgi:asparagine synthase (glutamine-hydrolysing)